MKPVTAHSIWLRLKKGSKSTDLLCLVLIAAVFIFYKLGAKSLTTFDEICYAQFSKEMFWHGNWLTPTSWGHPEFDKPPLYMIATSLAYHLFGVNEWGTRLCSALAGIGTVVVVYLFSNSVFNRRVAWLSALFLLSSVHFFNQARLATLDVTLTFFICLTLYFFWLGLRKQSFYFLSGLSLAGALMTKGLAGLLPLFILVPYLFFARETGSFKTWKLWGGLTLGLLFPILWGMYEYLLFGSAFLDGAFFTHLSRAHQTLDQHTGTFWMYLNVISYKGKLFGGVALGVAVWLLGEALFFKGDKKTLLFLSWAFVVLILFSLSKTKLHWYIIPIYPPLFILLSYFLDRLQFLRKYLAVFPILSLVFLIYYQSTNSHKFNDNANQSVKELSIKVKELKSPQDKLFVFGPHELLEERALVYYSDMIPSPIEELNSSVRSAFVVTDRDQVLILQVLLSGRGSEVFEYGAYALVRIF